MPKIAAAALAYSASEASDMMATIGNIFDRFTENEITQAIEGLTHEATILARAGAMAGRATTDEAYRGLAKLAVALLICTKSAGPTPSRPEVQTWKSWYTGDDAAVKTDIARFWSELKRSERTRNDAIAAQNAAIAAHERSEAERKKSEAELEEVRKYLKDIRVPGGFACHTTAVLVRDKALLAELKLLTEFPGPGDLVNILTQWSTSAGNYQKVQRALNDAYKEWESVVNTVQANQKASRDSAKAAAKNAVTLLLQELNVPLANTIGTVVGLVLTPLVQSVATVSGKIIDVVDSLVQSAEDAFADSVAEGILGPSDDQITKAPGAYDDPKKKIETVKRSTTENLYKYLIVGSSVHTDNLKGKLSAANDHTDMHMAADQKLLFEVSMALKDLWTKELAEFRKQNKGTINDRSNPFGAFVLRGVDESLSQIISGDMAVNIGIDLTDETHFLEYCLYKIFPAVQRQAASTQLFADEKRFDKAAPVFVKTIGKLVKTYATMLRGSFNANVTQVESLPSVHAEGIKDVLKVVLWMKCYDLTGADKPPPTVVDELVKLDVMERWNQGYGAMASNLFSRATLQSSRSRMDSDGRMDIYNAGKLRYGSGTTTELKELAAFAGKVGDWWGNNGKDLMTGKVSPDYAKNEFKRLAKESWILKEKGIVLPKPN